MNCAICAREARRALTGLGAFCGKAHCEEMLRRHGAYLEELRREDPGLMPEAFTEADFERFALKLALFLLDRISPDVRQLYRESTPALLEPMEMAGEVRGHLLRHLPASHVRVVELGGSSHLVHPDAYAFLQPVPAAFMRDAVCLAGLLPLLGIVPQEQGGAAP
jgi:hypothetical protein